MLVALLILLIIAVIFHEEIKDIISYVIIFAVAWGLWQMAWWGKMIVVIMVIGAATNVIFKIIEFFKKTFGEEKTKQEDELLDHQQDYKNKEHENFVPKNLWYFMTNGKDAGPYSEEQLLDLLRNRKLPPDTPIRIENNPKWSPAKNLWANRF